jgi:transposase
VVRRTWAPRGETPIQKSWDRHDRLSVISALTLAPYNQRFGLYFRIHDHNIRTEEVLEFIAYLYRHLRRRFLLVLDRWSVHRAAVRRLREADPWWLEVEWLPPYAPELNPTEQLWDHTKYADLANFLPDDVDHLSEAVAASIQETRSKATLIQSFFAYAKLEL